MKKIFTVLMAFGIALCTMANPTFSVAERLDLSKVATPKMEKQFTPVEKTSKAVRADKQEARQAMVEARQAKAVAPMAINGVRQVEAMPVAEKQALPVVNNKQRAAAQATAATDTVEIVATTWLWEYYESDNDWYTTLIDATKTYEIKLDYVSDTQAGTFTEADCLMDYTGMYIYDEEGYSTIVTFTEVDIVVTDDENGLALNAELLSTDSVLYVVSAFIAPLPEPKATVELAYANATLEDGTRTSETFQFWADENGVYTSILLASEQVEGVYDRFDMYVDYANYIMFVDGTDTTFVDFLDLNAVVTKEDKTYNLVADALGSDTIMYHITMSYTKPAPTDTIDIVATNMFVDEFEFWGQLWCTVSASNDEYTVTLDMANGLPMGELTSEDFNVEYSSVYRIADEEEIVFDEIISATVSEVEGKPAVKAQVVGVDNIVYNLDLSYIVPEPTDTVNVVFDDVVEAQYYGESADYYIVNENENYIVVLDIFEERGNLMGEYTAEDFDMYYTQLGVIEAGDTTAVEIADAKAVVTPVEEGIVLIEAELIGMNAVLYKVSTKADVSNKGLQYDATEGFLVDEYTTEDLYSISDNSNYGFIYFDAEAADGTDLLGLQFWVDAADENTTIPVGTYPINDSMEPGTVMASTGYGSQGLTYSLYATLDEEGYINIPCWFMVGGVVVVSEENGILSITVDAVNSNNLPIYITCEYDLSTKQGLQYDMTEGSVERTYSDADVVVINTDYVAQYGQLNFAITAADASDMISMVFFVEEADAEIGIPAGVYTIDDSGDYGTVYASPGVMDGSIYPSFYGNMNAQGQITIPCYFMVGGQVVVENVNGALKVTIDALNSYDVPAHIVYEASVPEPELPAASVRAWAYDLALAVEGEQYTFSYKATTAAKATLILTDAEGVELATKDLGIVEAGANTAVLAASELPTGEKVNWAIKLEAGAVAELVEVTDQTRGIYDFYNMMDVLVDNNPESEYFGKIYIQMAYNGASDGATDRADVQTAGLFIYDQELNELNDPSNVGIKPTLPEGYTMGDNRNKFHRLEIDPKTGKLAYCYNIAGSPAVFAIDRANLTGEVENLIAGVEGLNQTCALAFDAEGTLYLMNLANSAGAVYKIVDGQAVAMFEPTGKFVNASMSMAADGMGGLWIAQNRGQIDTYYQLAHVTKDGELDYTVFSGNNPDNLTGSSTRGALVYDAERQLLAQGRNGMVEVYSVAYNAETGVPALTLVATTPTVGTNIDGLAFDYAGDLYVVNSSKEKFQKFAMPTENNVCVTPAAAKYAFEIEGAIPVEMVGVVKRAVTVGDYTVVLTHEENGAAHLYKVVDGVAVAELSQEGVIAVDAENAGDFLAISDIAATEDGKLVAANKIVCQSGDDTVDEGYKRGEFRAYIWDDLAGAPSLLITSKMSSNWYRSVQGHTIAYKGTSTNGTLFTTGVTATGVKFRYSVYNVIDGVYTDPAVNDSEHFHFTKGSAQTTDVLGANYQLVASPLAATNWILDGELVDPFEIVDPLTYNTEVTANPALAIDLGKKYNGASVVTVGEQVLMVAPYATAEGLLAGVKVLDITAGLDAATEVATADLDAAVEATAAATAVAVAENVLTITLVADATIYTLNVELESEPNYMLLEDNITNLVIDLESMAIIGGPSTMWQVEVFLGLGQDNGDGTFTLTEESSVAIMGSDARFIDGYVYDIDVNAPAAKAVLHVEDYGSLYEIKLDMTNTPQEAIVVVVEDATVTIDTIPLFGDQVDYALKMTANWTDTTDNTTYPVLVEVPVYYPEATEPSEMTCTVTIGGWGENDPWLGFGEGTLTITTVDGVVTAKGIVANPYTGVAFDVTVSGKLPKGPGSGVDNVQVEVKTVKMIKNGQLIINRDGKSYNAQGATLK